MSDSDELKRITERAMIAEARVAELLEEQSRIDGGKPVTGSLSSSSGDDELRKRAEAEREDLRAQNTKLEQDLEEEEEKLRKALLELDKHKEHQQQITRLEEELKQARDAAASQPCEQPGRYKPSPPPPDTSGLEEQLKSKEEEVARLEEELRKAQDAAVSQPCEQPGRYEPSPPPPPPAPEAQAPSAPDTYRLKEQLKSKEEENSRLSRKLEALDHFGAERDELAKEVDDLRAQVVHLKDKIELGATGTDSAGDGGEVVEHLKTELEEMTKKQAASADEAQRLTQENMQLNEQLSALKRENQGLIKKAEEVRDEISIVSHARADGAQPETAVPPEVVPSGEPEGTPDTTPETVPTGTVPTWPSGEPIREVLPQKEPPQDVVVDTPESPPPEEVLERTLEDSLLAELEPLPMPAVSAPPEPELAPSPSKGGWFLKVFLFLILIGGAFLAAQHFLPRFLYPPAAEQPPAEVVVPEGVPPGKPEGTPEPPPPPPEIPAEPAEKALKEAPAPAPEKPVEKVVEKKSRTEKRKPKETAKAREPKKTVKAGEPKKTVSEIKRQIRRLISSKQLDEAQKLLVEWVKKHPKEAGLRYLYGRLYLLLGKKNDAVDQLEEAIGLAPKMASAYHDLGAVYLQLGDNESACEALGHFVRLKPDHPRTPAVQDLMKKVKCP